MFVESESVELKEKYSDSVCKEIVAFLNTNGGKLIIGVNDCGTIVGITNVDETSRKISDVITDQIEPNPQSLISSEIKYEDGKMFIIVNVPRGIQPIYCQKKHGFSSAGCFIRIGTTTKSMTEEEIHSRYQKNFTNRDLMLVTPARYGDISFNTIQLTYMLRGFHLGEERFEANLNLRTPDGQYNQLAELLSDHNTIPMILVKFRGKDKSKLSENYNYGNKCILTAYETMKNKIVAENICISDTTVRPREDKYLYDFDSVNEAVINAFVHNDWNISQPTISYFDDRIEILSYGGLPNNQTEDKFFKGISSPRNEMLMRIFLDMHLTERTGHGIPAIVSKYGKDIFDIDSSYIKVTIPFDKEVLEKSRPAPLASKENTNLTKTEKRILKILIDNPYATSDVLADDIGVNARTIERAFLTLQEKGLLARTGSKRIGRWCVLEENFNTSLE